MSIVLQGSTSGSITLQEPAVAGSTVIDLPATTGTALVAPTALTVPNTTGTVMVSGNMPAFSAYLNSNQTGISSNTWTKVSLANTVFDTASCFNTSTYRFTPTTAGYYQISSVVTNNYTGSAINNYGCAVYKNGAVYSATRNYGNWGCAHVNTVIYMNGTTDYLELYGYCSGGTGLQFDGYTNFPNAYTTWMSGVLVRAA